MSAVWMSALLCLASDICLCLCLLVLLIPGLAKLVVQSKDRGVELFAAYRRWVSVKVLGDRRRRDGRRSANHADVLPRSADVGIRLKDLSDDTVDIWRLLSLQPEALVLPALLLVLRPGPLPTPEICRYCFSAVAAACSSTRRAMSVPVRSARK